MVSLSRQISLVGLTGLALLCLAAPVWAVDGRIQDIRYNATNRHFQISSAGVVKATVNTLNIAGHKRIIIDVDNAEIGTDLPRDVQLLHTLSRQLPALKNVTVNQYAGNGRPIVRILMDIEGDPGTIRLVRNQGNQIELEFNESANWTSRNNYSQPPNLSRLEPSRLEPTTPSGQTGQMKAPQNQFEDTDLRRTLAILNQKYELQAQENQYLKARLTTAESEQSAKQSQQDNSRAELTRLKSDLDRLKAENNTLQSRLNTLNVETQRPDPALYAKEAEIARLKSENQSLNNRLSTALNTAKNTAQNTANDVTLTSMKQSLAELNRRYDLLVTENQGLKTRLNTQNTQASTEKSYKLDWEKLNQAHQSLIGENKQLKSELSLAKNTPQKVASVPDADLAALRKQLSTAQSSLSESILTINQQNKELAYLRNQVNDLKSGLSDSSKEQMAAMQSEITQLQRAGQNQEQIQRELNTTRAELESLRKAATTNKGNNADKQRIAQLAQEKQTLQNELENLKQAQTQSKATSEDSSELQAQIKRLQADLADAKNQYEKASQEALQAKQALKSASNKPATPAASVKGGTNPAQQKQIESLTQQLASLKQENSSLRETLNSSATANRKSSVTNTEAEQEYTAGKTALAEKKMPVALDKLKKALLLDQDNSKYAVDYGVALAEDRQFAEAIDVLRRYIQRNPGDREAYNQLGKIYLLNDQPDAANQAFTRAIPISVLNNYATSLKKLGNNTEAESVFKLALAINPKDSEVLFNLGNLYNADNKLEEARNKYLEAIQIRPGFAEAHYNLGLIFSKLGDNAKALTHLEKYLQLSPNARNAETIRAYMQKLKA